MKSRSYNALISFALSTIIIFILITSSGHAQNGQNSVLYSDSIIMEYNNARNIYQSGNYEIALSIFERTGDQCLKIQDWKYY